MTLWSEVLRSTLIVISRVCLQKLEIVSNKAYSNKIKHNSLDLYDKRPRLVSKPITLEIFAKNIVNYSVYYVTSLLFCSYSSSVLFKASCHQLDILCCESRQPIIEEEDLLES